jgi:hypothetical protein
MKGKNSQRLYKDDQQWAMKGLSTLMTQDKIKKTIENDYFFKLPVTSSLE